MLFMSNIFHALPTGHMSVNTFSTLSHHEQAKLMKAVIQLYEFKSSKPHYFTYFWHGNNAYIDVFTHSKTVGDHKNTLFPGNMDLNGNKLSQYVAHFKINAGEALDFEKWQRFKMIENHEILERFNLHYNEFYTREHVCNRARRQDMYIHTGVRVGFPYPKH